jgi:hypothetical protein
MASPEDALRTAAAAYTPLSSLLGYDGSNPNTFRWYDTRLMQKTPFPALVLTLISAPQSTTFEHNLATGYWRFQFEIWDYDPDNAYTVQTQLEAFIGQFNGYGLAGLLVNNASQILNRRKMMYADTQPSQYQRIVDARIFFNLLKI